MGQLGEANWLARKEKDVEESRKKIGTELKNEFSELQAFKKALVTDFAGETGAP